MSDARDAEEYTDEELAERLHTGVALDYIDGPAVEDALEAARRLESSHDPDVPDLADIQRWIDMYQHDKEKYGALRYYRSLPKLIHDELVRFYTPRPVARLDDTEDQP